MNSGDVVLLPLPQFGGGGAKLRPALVLSLLLGPYQNVLLCGISTQLHLIQANWDEWMQPSDGDFVGSGLRQASAIRLSYLYAADAMEIIGTIGQIDPRDWRDCGLGWPITCVRERDLLVASWRN